MKSFIIVLTLLSLVCQFLAQLADDTEAQDPTKARIILKNFFDPSVRKQLIRMDLHDLPIYVKTGKEYLRMYKEEDSPALIAIVGKSDLLVIPYRKEEMKELTRDYLLQNMYMFEFNNFIDEAEGSNCATSLILPHVIVLCDDTSYVFKPQKDGGMNRTFFFPVGFPGLNIAVEPYPESTRLAWMFQHVPGGGLIFMIEPIDFDYEELDFTIHLGFTSEEINNLTDDSFLKTNWANRKFQYLTLIDGYTKASLSRDPTPEGKEQWKLGPPVIYFTENFQITHSPYSERIFLFSRLTTSNGRIPFYQAEKMFSYLRDDEIWLLKTVDFNFSGNYTSSYTTDKPTRKPSQSLNMSRFFILIAIVMVIVVIVIFGMLVAEQLNSNQQICLPGKNAANIYRKTPETARKVTSGKIKADKNKVDTTGIDSTGGQNSKTHQSSNV